MSDTVFVLGAGASKAAGAPLMANFLDTAHELWKTGKVQDVESDFARVFGAVSALQAVHSKATLDINNVESVFATLEMVAMLRKFPAPPSVDVDVDAMVESLKLVIGTTLERTIEIPWRQGRPQPPHPYGQFAKLIRHLLADADPRRTVSIITFNYDLACDFGLHCAQIPVDYALNDSRQSGAVPLLKLHGSLNWVYCQELDRVVPWTLKALATDLDTGDTIELTPRLDSACHFFEPFRVGDYLVQLRLDWTDIDENGHPRLDADFFNAVTGKPDHSMRGHPAHHTASEGSDARTYQWGFEEVARRFTVAVTWSAAPPAAPTDVSRQRSSRAARPSKRLSSPKSKRRLDASTREPGSGSAARPLGP